MSLSKGRLAMAGTFVLFVTVLLNFPANLAAGWIKRNTAIPLEWQSIEGSIFSTDIYGLSIPTLSGNFLYIDRTSLNTSIFPLMFGNLTSEIHVMTGNSEIIGESNLTFSEWEVSNLTGELVFSDFVDSFPELELFGISGKLILRSDLIMGNYKDLTDSENISLKLFNLNCAMFNSSRPFGDYQIKLESISTQKISASISNLPGDNQLLINSKLNFDKLNNKIRINGYAWLSDNADKSLNELLFLLGTQENNRTLIIWETNTEF
jgi:hypothetical protein